MTAVLDPAIEDRKSKYNEPLIHIYEEPYEISLCGLKLDTSTDLPWHRGIYDCAQCWAIHQLQEAGEL